MIKLEKALDKPEALLKIFEFFSKNEYIPHISHWNIPDVPYDVIKAVNRHISPEEGLSKKYEVIFTKQNHGLIEPGGFNELIRDSLFIKNEHQNLVYLGRIDSSYVSGEHLDNIPQMSVIKRDSEFDLNDSFAKFLHEAILEIG